MYRLTYLFFVMIGVSFLNGCASMPSPGGKPLPLMTFEHVQPIEISSARYTVLNEHKTDIVNGDVGQDFVVPPNIKIEEYLNKRFVATDRDHSQLEVTIEKAPVYHAHTVAEREDLQFLDIGGRDSYTIKVRLSFSGLNYPDYARKTVVLEGQRTVNITEHASIAEREKAQIEAVYALISDLDDDIIQIVTEQLGL